MFLSGKSTWNAQGRAYGRLCAGAHTKGRAKRSGQGQRKHASGALEDHRCGSSWNRGGSDPFAARPEKEKKKAPGKEKKAAADQKAQAETGLVK